MMLSFFILFFFCESTVKSQTTTWPASYVFSSETSKTTVAAEEKRSPLQLVVTPNYPVAAGQRLVLHCTAFTVPDSVMWSWQRLENQTWHEVGILRDLTLTEPEQSGLYCCRAESNLSQSVSPNHTVYIISMQATVAENLGIAAFVLSLLALILNFSILCWLGFQRFDATPTTSNATAKGFPASEKSPKGGFPKTESDGGVYMNYTNTSQAYTDLDPTNVTENNVYSSLS